MSHHVRKVSAFSLDMEDRVGELLKVTQDLVGHGVNLRAIWAWAGDEGTARAMFVPEDPSLVSGCGCKTCCAAQESTVLWLDVADRMGVLNENLAKLAAAGINLKAVQAVGIGGQAAAILAFADEATLDKALAVLEECCGG